MKNYQEKNKINRILDANINRLKEGLRVCEDVIRFSIDEHCLWLKFKKIRHSLFSELKNLIPQQDLIKARNTASDVGKTTILAELKRKNCQEIFSANIQRVKESLRVIEEFSKILDRKKSGKFKDIRYKIYSLEKEANLKL